MVNSTNTNDELLDEVMDVLTEDDPAKKLPVSDQERLSILERIAKVPEGSIMDQKLHDDIITLLERAADMEAVEHRERAGLLANVQRRAKPEMTETELAIIADVARQQREVQTSISAEADGMKNDVLAHVEGTARAEQQGKEAVSRAQSDEEAERIRRQLQQGPEFSSTI
jgi:hypothetical protein